MLWKHDLLIVSPMIQLCNKKTENECHMLLLDRDPLKFKLNMIRNVSVILSEILNLI